MSLFAKKRDTELVRLPAVVPTGLYERHDRIVRGLLDEIRALEARIIALEYERNALATRIGMERLY